MSSTTWVPVSWATLKAFADDRDLALQYIDEGSFYHIRANDNGYGMECKIFKINEAADQADFETNYMPGANAKIQATDYNGDPLIRPKVTVSGWHYSPRAINWTTCLLNSVHNKTCHGADIGDAGVRFFDGSNTELVQGGSESDVDFQARLDTDCVKTVMWFLPLDAPYDIVGSMFCVKVAPTVDTYAFLTIAPDIPEEMGGNCPFFSGGMNLSMLADKQVVYLNGRGAKTVFPDPDYHSNEMWLAIAHPAGQKTQCQIVYELYKE